MADFQDMSPGLASLDSQEQNDLMAAIDKLRPLSLQHELDLPQLIVCGKQSAGKSSVLEAISGVAFRTGSGTVTTFATELVLRKSRTESMAASLVLASGTSLADRETLLQFRPTLGGLDDFPRILQETSTHLAIVPRRGTFTRHRLQIEISGPKQPHLTLIDMPGLIANVTDDDLKSDIDDAKARVNSYMTQPKSIILAVMPAIGDIKDQEVFKLASEADPQRSRTLGILTMPDRVETGNIEHYIRLMQNQEIPLGLGWHTLKNLGPAVHDRSPRLRDDEETAFFTDRHSLWSTLTPGDLGVEALRTKSRSVLFRSITETLPVLRREIDCKIEACEQHLADLGAPRTTYSENLSYLSNISSELATVIHSASNAEYNQPFFSPALADSDSVNLLRTRIQDYCDKFSWAMIENGQLYHVTDRCGRRDMRASWASHLSRRPCARNYMQRLRGRELPGEYSPYIIGQIFKLMATPWEDLAHSLTEQCLNAAQHFFKSALDTCTGSSHHTAKAIYEHVVATRFDQCKTTVRIKVKELVSPFQTTYPNTRNPRYLESRRRRDLGVMQDDFRLHGQPECEEAAEHVRNPGQRVLNGVLSYYETSHWTFIDNIVSLAVEKCIIEPLKDFFTVSAILQLDSATFNAIASEPSTVVHDRGQNLQNLEVLREVRGICNRHIYFRAEDSLNDVTHYSAQRQYEQQAAQTPKEAKHDSVPPFTRQDPAMQTPPRTPKSGPATEILASRNKRSALLDPAQRAYPRGEQLHPPHLDFDA